VNNRWRIEPKPLPCSEKYFLVGLNQDFFPLSLLSRLHAPLTFSQVNQKIQAKGKKIADVVLDLKNGDMLISLLEVLSEQEFTNWKKIQGGAILFNYSHTIRSGGSRIKQVEACSQALQFVDKCGNNPNNATLISPIINPNNHNNRC
jgi:hypothetical protein